MSRQTELAEAVRDGLNAQGLAFVVNPLGAEVKEFVQGGAMNFANPKTFVRPLNPIPTQEARNIIFWRLPVQVILLRYAVNDQVNQFGQLRLLFEQISLYLATTKTFNGASFQPYNFTGFGEADLLNSVSESLIHETGMLVLGLQIDYLLKENI